MEAWRLVKGRLSWEGTGPGARGHVDGTGGGGGLRVLAVLKGER